MSLQFNNGSSQNAITKYHWSLRVLHWVIGLLVIAMLAMGWYMAALDPSDQKWALYGLHKSIGITIFLFMVFRVISRIITKIPAAPQQLPKWQKSLGTITHYVIYIMLFIMPLSGVLCSQYGGYPVNFFSYKIPNLVQVDKNLFLFWGKVHYFTPFLLAAIIFLHVAAAIKHQFIDKIEKFIRRII